ncbi:hypothetical protein AB0F77_25710 [Streptomyces sp. NPDC026672]
MSPEHLTLPLACALFSRDAASAAARLLGLPADPAPSVASSSYARTLGV